MENHLQLQNCLIELRDGIRPYCEKTWKRKYDVNWLQTVKEKLKSSDYDKYKHYDRLRSTGDVAFLLKAMIATWHEVWDYEFDGPEHTLVFELLAIRNRHSHNEEFSTADTYRALDTIERLLESFSAKHQQVTVRKQRVKSKRKDLLRQYYDEQKSAELREAEAIVEQQQAEIQELEDSLRQRDDEQAIAELQQVETQKQLDDLLRQRDEEWARAELQQAEISAEQAEIEIQQPEDSLRQEDEEQAAAELQRAEMDAEQEVAETQQPEDSLSQWYEERAMAELQQAEIQEKLDDLLRQRDEERAMAELLQVEIQEKLDDLLRQRDEERARAERQEAEIQKQIDDLLHQWYEERARDVQRQAEIQRLEDSLGERFGDQARSEHDTIKSKATEGGGEPQPKQTLWQKITRKKWHSQR